MRKKGSPTIWIFIGIAGLCLALYPLVGSAFSTRRDSRKVLQYQQNISEQGQDVYEAVRRSARAYNASLARHLDAELIFQETGLRYDDTLLSGDSDMIASIVIPKINVSLPIYHGTGDDVMSRGIGHLEGTSLPIGGVGSHAVLSGHRGLPDAVLFTNLDLLKIGDYFKIQVLGDELVYCVDQIRVVEPDDTGELLIDPQKDLVTLLTCTPYGINSHRLLVRGERVTEEKTITEQEFRSLGVDPLLSVSLITLSLLLGIFVLVVISARRKKQRQADDLQRKI